MNECIWHDFGCLEPAQRRDDGTWACVLHQHVHIADSGSWLEVEAS